MALFVNEASVDKPGKHLDSSPHSAVIENGSDEFYIIRTTEISQKALPALNKEDRR